MFHEDEKRKNYKICSNCNKQGHEFKECKSPIVSMGVILLKISGNDKSDKNELTTILKEEVKSEQEQMGIRGKDFRDLELFSIYKDNLRFLLIRRKHTLGYIEFLRGRYKTDNFEGIIFLFQQMTSEEIEKIGTLTFEELWEDLWGSGERKNNLQSEFEKSKKNFEELKNNKKELGLNFYVKNVSPSWDQAEWGFPKGRKNKNENNLECAMREFEEETGYKRDEYEILTNISPLIEEFIGTNGVSYKHIYYIGIDKTNKIPKIDTENKSQIGEIGAIGFYTFQETIQLIRPYHIQRKRIVNKLYSYLMNKIIVKLNN